MKIFHKDNVYEAAKKRLHFIFDEFEDIYVCVSGGKDSTVALFMTLEVARERGRKVGLYFLDQEFEYQSTIDIIRKWMSLPEVIPYWYQIPLKMYNANSSLCPTVEIWAQDRKDTWMRPQEEISIKEPFCSSDRFHGNMHTFTDYRHSVTGLKTCEITGMRAEESFNRFQGMTAYLAYKDVSWARKNKNSITFHPFYDWSYRDVWKYINDNNLEYNECYDKFYQLGFSIRNMRVSNLIHEYTQDTIIFLQEVEPSTYERLTLALPGISTTAKFMEDFIPKKLPEMFVSWKEYRDYLLLTIVPPEERQGYLDAWKTQPDDERIYRVNCIECIKSDFTHTINKDRAQRIAFNKRRTDNIKSGAYVEEGKYKKEEE